MDCPRCAGQMVKRKRASDSHEFYGCKNFPKCRGTREVDGSTYWTRHPDPHGNMDLPGDDIFDLDNGGWGMD